jgi:biopolymer transport protein TolQ
LYYLFFAFQAEVAANQNLLDLIWRSSFIAKLVLLTLLGFSVLSWGIIITKYLAFARAEKQTNAFLALFRRSSRLAEVQASCQTYKESPLAGVFLAGYQEIDKQVQKNPDSPNNIKSIAAIGRALQRACISETTRLESGVGWLASTASASPFIGLFGTVVGIIIAFEGLSLSTQASIQAVAPGIAEALIATAAGIAAAVPAALAYNHFLNKIKVLTSEMDDFSLEFLNLVERNFS